MPKDDYPLHPGQTHAEPLYCQIPLEEYESIKKENKALKEAKKMETDLLGGLKMDKIAESIKALAAAVQTAADAYARYVDTYCREAETYREKYEKEAQIRKIAMEAMGDAMADKRRRS